MRPRWLPASAALALVAGAVAWALAGLPGAAASCPPVGCDCEVPGPGPVRQPANAWSSLALCLAGAALLSASPAAARGARPKAGATLAATALVGAGLAAYLFHASLIAWTARLDGIAAAILAGALGLETWDRWRRRLPLRARQMLAAALLLGLGGLCWLLGRPGGAWCRPGSPLPVHAAWHLLVAAAVGLWLQAPSPSAGGGSGNSPQPLASGREEQPAP